MKKLSLEQKNDIFFIISIVSVYLLYFIFLLIIFSIGGK